MERLWLHFTCQWHTEEHVCARVQAVACLSLHVYDICTQCVCVCVCVCYAWRHTCTNRVVVDSDSCPVPFTAQSSQPPLCSIRLLMRINVLWRPVGLPHLHPPNSTANEEIQPCQNTEVERECVWHRLGMTKRDTHAICKTMCKNRYANKKGVLFQDTGVKMGVSIDCWRWESMYCWTGNKQSHNEVWPRCKTRVLDGHTLPQGCYRQWLPCLSPRNSPHTHFARQETLLRSMDDTTAWPQNSICVTDRRMQNTSGNLFNQCQAH